MDKEQIIELNKADKEILEKLQRVLRSYLKEDQIIGLNDELVNDLGLESIDIIDVIMDLEDLFALEIKDDELDQFNVVSDIIEAIKLKTNE